MMKSGGTHEYALWDAAYVLGSLPRAERREYEDHLSVCASCRDAVGELSGMPALLGRLSRDDVEAIDDAAAHGADSTPGLRPQVLGSLLAKVSWRRRRERVMIWTMAAAAAVVLATGVFVALQGTAAQTPVPPSQIQAAALTMLPVKPSAITATVTLTGHSWGTRIDISCTYSAAAENASHEPEDGAGDKLAMVVVGRDGSQAQLATWVALTGVTATPAGHTSMPIDEIASVQIVSAETADVLLERTL